MIDVKQMARAAAMIVVAAATPAFASQTSPMTRAFLANVTPNVRFLAQSSRLAETASARTPVRAFARAEQIEETRVAATLSGETLSGETNIASTADALLSGRSVATDGAGLGQAANGRPPIAQADLDHLATLSGRPFDDLYWEKQLDALSQLHADYTTYIAAGDDARLVALAKRELPKVERQLMELSKV